MIPFEKVAVSAEVRLYGDMPTHVLGRSNEGLRRELTKDWEYVERVYEWLPSRTAPRARTGFMCSSLRPIGMSLVRIGDIG